MSSFNQVILMGNLTRDIELNYTASGTAIGSFGIAVNESWKSASGEKKERVTFVDCDSFGKTAEVMKQYLARGSPIMIVGKLRLDEWQEKNGGGKRSKLKVSVNSFTFVGSKREDAQTDQPTPSTIKSRPTNRPASTGQGFIGDDDIPF